jgi:succinoglycan biosynthesis transport protein ExoP
MSTAETGRTLSDYQGLLRRRRHYLLTIIPASLLVAVFIAFVLPPKYRAAGTIMLEDSSLPQNVVATQVTQEDDNAERAAQTLELLRRKVMTKDSLLEVVQQIDPYPNLPNMTPAQKGQSDPGGQFRRACRSAHVPAA